MIRLLTPIPRLNNTAIRLFLLGLTTMLTGVCFVTETSHIANPRTAEWELVGFKIKGSICIAGCKKGKGAGYEGRRHKRLISKLLIKFCRVSCGTEGQPIRRHLL